MAIVLALMRSTSVPSSGLFGSGAPERFWASTGPDSSAMRIAPDFASLHPGYDVPTYDRSPGASCPVRATYSV